MTEHRAGRQGSWLTTNCPSGKRGHTSRRSAKQHASRLRAEQGDHLRPYLCDDCGYWHIGHVPSDVIRGVRSADSHYQRDARRRAQGDTP